jgi:hypothetical protein
MQGRLFGNHYKSNAGRANIRDNSNHWSLYLDGESVATQTGNATIDQTTYWMIGRARGGDIHPFDGEISDVKGYDAIPEPGTLSLLGLLLRRRFRR